MAALRELRAPEGAVTDAEKRSIWRSYDNVAEWVGDTAWAMHPQALQTVVSIIAERQAGITPTDLEIAERIGEKRQAATPSSPGLAVINVEGPIMPKGNLLTEVSGATSIEGLQSEFRAALADPDVKAIVFNIDSPGGSAELVPELASEILAARGQKPIVASANTWAASAAYWIASACDEICVTPSGEVGSIGVWTAHQDLSEAMKAQGVKTTLVSAGKYKVEGNPYEPLDPEAQAEMQRGVDAIYKSFLKAVAKGRGTTPATVRDGYGEGRMVMASEAVGEGLADRVETIDQTLARVSKKVGIKPQAAPEPESALDDLMDMFAGEAKPDMVILSKGSHTHSLEPELVEDMDLISFRNAYGTLGETEIRTVPLTEIRSQGGDGGEPFLVSGHAAVFGVLSLDLGGFREIIAPDAFTDVLKTDPDVHLLWNHDTKAVLARTKNGTLDLDQDERGLAFAAECAPTSYARDLKILMDRKDVDQASFAFTVEEDEWEVEYVEGKEIVTRTVLKVKNLFDATICAQGAYPAADSSSVRSYIRSYARSRMEPIVEAPTADYECKECGDALTREIAFLSQVDGEIRCQECTVLNDTVWGPDEAEVEEFEDSDEPDEVDPRALIVAVARARAAAARAKAR